MIRPKVRLLMNKSIVNAKNFKYSQPLYTNQRRSVNLNLWLIKPLKPNM